MNLVNPLFLSTQHLEYILGSLRESYEATFDLRYEQTYNAIALQCGLPALKTRQAHELHHDLREGVS